MISRATKRRVMMGALLTPLRHPSDQQYVPPSETEVRLRWASDDDELVLGELAALDGAGVPAAPVLIGEVEGHPWAAISLRTGQLVADPFRPTASVSELLRVRAEQITVAASTRPAAGLQ